MYDVAVSSIPAPPRTQKTHDDLDHHPRERLLTHGAAALSDAELLSVLIGNGQSAAASLAAAGRLLRQIGGLAGLRDRRPEYFRFHGIAPVASVTLSAAFELGVRLLKADVPSVNPLSDLPTLASYLALRYSLPDQEVMGAIYLDERGRVIDECEIYRGTLCRAAVEPRGILKHALLIAAESIILFHTHPSGTPEPSGEDLLFTQRMYQAGEIFGVKLLDHIVLGDGRRYVSMRTQRRR